MNVEVTWNGPAVEALVERALKIGIDKTTSDAAIEAKRLVHVDTSTRQGAIYPEAAKANGDGTVEGVYGPHDVEYAVYQEFMLGEQMPDGNTRARTGGKSYMRPSMANAEKNLQGNIADAWRGLQ